MRALLVCILLAMAAYIAFLKWPKASISKGDAEITATATTIYDAFSNDETAATTKYYGKVIKLSGTVDEIYKDENNSPVVILRNTESEPVAVVTLEPSQSDEIKTYKEGSDIQIVAQCTGMLMEVTYNKGLISS